MEKGSLTPLERSQLTESQLRIWDARFGEDPPVPLREVERRLGLPPGGSGSPYSKALKTLGRETGQNGGQSLGEIKFLNEDPDKAAEAMVELANPLADSVKQVAEEVGVPYRVALALYHRMDGRFLPLARALGETQRPELSDHFALTAFRLLASLSDKDIEKMPGYQRVIAACAATDKHLLLEGQPTEVMSVKELRSLEVLTDGLLKEAQRRGLVAHTEPETQRVMLEAGELADGSPDIHPSQRP